LIRPTASTPLHVLVIDDSAVVREVLGMVLGAMPGFTVTTAADPLLALEKIRRATPDVIILDLDMPRMDGLTFLRRLPRPPIPVIVCSGVAGRGTYRAVEILAAGAVEVVSKPEIGIRDFLAGSGERLARLIRDAAETGRRRRPEAGHRLSAESRPAASPTPSVRVVAVGASTGGTEAIGTIVRKLPVNAPGLVVVQHMPAGFTAAFARQLDRQVEVVVMEAAEGDVIRPGQVLIAPGSHHLRLESRGGELVVRLSLDPPVRSHRPSVDVLFRSVAHAAGSRAIGVILTGMGDDGADGLVEMRRAGARTIAQDEATSVVFGMPGEAIRRGAVERTLPLPGIASALIVA
jgi:two-component system, chemotaxis family, protein-glutamate methylesterase/glutaminase